jgi:oligopeptide transport system substrate-binding protein
MCRCFNARKDLFLQSPKTRKVLYLSSILFTLMLLLAACGNGQNNNSSSNNIASPDKQVLREPHEGGDFDSLDPALTYSGLGEPYNLIYSGLVTLNDDGTVAKQLAQSYQASQDGLTYTFHLRQGLKFSDGTPLTANDVAYSLNRVLLPATKSPVSGYLSLLKDYDQITTGKKPSLIGDSIIVQDANTIQLVISQPAAYFLEALSYSTGDVVEQKLVDKYGATWTDHLSEGGGDGPFKVQSYGHTSSLVLVPNPNYYGFQPKLQKIVYVIASDRDSIYKSYQAKQYDLAPVPPSQDAIARKQPGFQQVSALASRFIEMNYLVKPLDNVQIRQALSLAINKDLVINHIINVNGPVVTPSNHIILKGIPGYNPNLTGPAGVASTAGDQTKAVQLFQEGLKAEGYASAAQFPALTIAYDNSYPAGANTIIAIVAEWKSVLGINIKAVGEQPNQLAQDETNTIGHAGPLQLWYGVWGADYPDPQDWLSNFFGKGASENYANYGQNNSATATQQQAIQAELARADADQNQAERLQLYQDAEQKIINDAGWITTYQSSYVYSVNPKLHGWKLNSLGSLATDDWQDIYFVQ